MTTLREAATQALEALENAEDQLAKPYSTGARCAITALRAALAEPVQEPEWEIRADGARVRIDRWQIGIRRIVALLWGNRREFEVDEVVEAVRALVPNPYVDGDDEALPWQALAEPEPQRKPLTDEEINSLGWEQGQSLRDFIRAIEQAHGIGSKT
jgi:hypothetical protein